MSRVEEPKYTVVEIRDAIELRDYATRIVAETEVAGARAEAINTGFRIIADYIFGNNQGARKVAMTAPVSQQPGEKIAMAAPVLQQAGGDTWTVRFVMPASWTLDTLPTPNNPAVKLRAIPGQRLAVIRFSGRATDASLRERTEELLAFLTARGLKALSAPTYAFYNPPWTLPMWRRNEVMVEIAP